MLDVKTALLIVCGVMLFLGVILIFKGRSGGRVNRRQYEERVMSRAWYHELKATTPMLPVPNLKGEGMVWIIDLRCKKCDYKEYIDDPREIKSWRWLAAGFYANPRPVRNPGYKLSCPSGRDTPGKFIPPDLSDIRSQHPDHLILSVPLE